MENIDYIYKILKKEIQNYDVPVVELMKIQTNDPFKVLVTTILSARTKDQMTKEVVIRLFKKIKKVEDFNKYSVKEIEELIYPIGFFRTKAKHLKQLPIALKEKFNNILPQTVEELCELPGVGRKTANLVVAVAFEKPAICVDVHVHRIMNRFGYVKTKTPFETEMALRKKLPVKYWLDINHIIVAFGQHHCSPINPKCSSCKVYNYCKRVGVEKSK